MKSGSSEESRVKSENCAVEAMHRIKEIGRKSKDALESGDYIKCQVVG